MTTIVISAQSNNLPKNAKTGKCYLKMTSAANFDYAMQYDRKNMFKEVSCNNAKEKKATQEQESKYRAYQQTLKDLGYDVVVTGKASAKFIEAHNQYLKAQTKANKKRRKILNGL